MNRLLVAGSVAALLVGLPLAGQISSPATKNASTSSKTFTPPKTAWGDPDIQGQWPADSNIPMQRPLSQAEKSSLSPEELAKREEQFRKQAEQDSEEFASPKGTTSSINPPGYWVE